MHPTASAHPNRGGAGWRRAKDAAGRVYYYHSGSRQTSWERPAELGSEAAPVDLVRSPERLDPAPEDASTVALRRARELLASMNYVPNETPSSALLGASQQRAKRATIRPSLYDPGFRQDGSPLSAPLNSATDAELIPRLPGLGLANSRGRPYSLAQPAALESSPERAARRGASSLQWDRRNSSAMAAEETRGSPIASSSIAATTTAAPSAAPAELPSEGVALDTDGGAAFHLGSEAAAEGAAAVLSQPYAAAAKRPDLVSILAAHMYEVAALREMEGQAPPGNLHATLLVEGVLPVDIGRGAALSPRSAPLQLSGSLHKKSRGGLRSWLRRFWVTHRWLLIYYSSDAATAASPAAVIDLRGVTEMRVGAEVIWARGQQQQPQDDAGDAAGASRKPPGSVTAAAAAAGGGHNPRKLRLNTGSYSSGGRAGRVEGEPAPSVRPSVPVPEPAEAWSQAVFVAVRDGLIPKPPSRGSLSPAEVMARDTASAEVCRLLEIEGPDIGRYTLRGESVEDTDRWYVGLLRTFAEFGCAASAGSLLLKWQGELTRRQQSSGPPAPPRQLTFPPTDDASGAQQGLELQHAPGTLGLPAEASLPDAVSGDLSQQGGPTPATTAAAAPGPGRRVRNELRVRIEESSIARTHNSLLSGEAVAHSRPEDAAPKPGTHTPSSSNGRATSTPFSLAALARTFSRRSHVSGHDLSVSVSPRGAAAAAVVEDGTHGVDPAAAPSASPPATSALASMTPIGLNSEDAARIDAYFGVDGSSSAEWLHEEGMPAPVGATAPAQLASPTTARRDSSLLSADEPEVEAAPAPPTPAASEPQLLPVRAAAPVRPLQSQHRGAHSFRYDASGGLNFSSAQDSGGPESSIEALDPWVTLAALRRPATTVRPLPYLAAVVVEPAGTRSAADVAAAPAAVALAAPARESVAVPSSGTPLRVQAASSASQAVGASAALQNGAAPRPPPSGLKRPLAEPATAQPPVSATAQPPVSAPPQTPVAAATHGSVIGSRPKSSKVARISSTLFKREADAAVLSSPRDPAVDRPVSQRVYGRTGAPLPPHHSREAAIPGSVVAAGSSSESGSGGSESRGGATVHDRAQLGPAEMGASSSPAAAAPSLSPSKPTHPPAHRGSSTPAPQAGGAGHNTVVGGKPSPPQIARGVVNRSSGQPGTRMHSRDAGESSNHSEDEGAEADGAPSATAPTPPRARPPQRPKPATVVARGGMQPPQQPRPPLRYSNQPHMLGSSPQPVVRADAAAAIAAPRASPSASTALNPEDTATAPQVLSPASPGVVKGPTQHGQQAASTAVSGPSSTPQLVTPAEPRSVSAPIALAPAPTPTDSSALHGLEGSPASASSTAGRLLPSSTPTAELAATVIATVHPPSATAQLPMVDLHQAALHSLLSGYASSGTSHPTGVGASSLDISAYLPLVLTAALTHTPINIQELVDAVEKARSAQLVVKLHGDDAHAGTSTPVSALAVGAHGTVFDETRVVGVGALARSASAPPSPTLRATAPSPAVAAEQAPRVDAVDGLLGSGTPLGLEGWPAIEETQAPGAQPKSTSGPAPREDAPSPSSSAHHQSLHPLLPTRDAQQQWPALSPAAQRDEAALASPPVAEAHPQSPTPPPRSISPSSSARHVHRSTSPTAAAGDIKGALTSHALSSDTVPVTRSREYSFISDDAQPDGAPAAAAVWSVTGALVSHLLLAAPVASFAAVPLAGVPEARVSGAPGASPSAPHGATASLSASSPPASEPTHHHHAAWAPVTGWAPTHAEAVTQDLSGHVASDDDDDEGEGEPREITAPHRAVSERFPSSRTNCSEDSAASAYALHGAWGTQRRVVQPAARNAGAVPAASALQPGPFVDEQRVGSTAVPKLQPPPVTKTVSWASSPGNHGAPLLVLPPESTIFSPAHIAPLPMEALEPAAADLFGAGPATATSAADGEDLSTLQGSLEAAFPTGELSPAASTLSPLQEQAPVVAAQQPEIADATSPEARAHVYSALRILSQLSSSSSDPAHSTLESHHPDRCAVPHLHLPLSSGSLLWLQQRTLAQRTRLRDAYARLLLLEDALSATAEADLQAPPCLIASPADLGRLSSVPHGEAACAAAAAALDAFVRHFREADPPLLVAALAVPLLSRSSSSPQERRSTALELASSLAVYWYPCATSDLAVSSRYLLWIQRCAAVAAQSGDSAAPAHCMLDALCSKLLQWCHSSVSPFLVSSVDSAASPSSDSIAHLPTLQPLQRVLSAWWDTVFCAAGAPPIAHPSTAQLPTASMVRVAVFSVPRLLSLLAHDPASIDAIPFQLAAAVAVVSATAGLQRAASTLLMHVLVPLLGLSANGSALHAGVSTPEASAACAAVQRTLSSICNMSGGLEWACAEDPLELGVAAGCAAAAAEVSGCWVEIGGAICGEVSSLQGLQVNAGAAAGGRGSNEYSDALLQRYNPLAAALNDASEAEAAASSAALALGRPLYVLDSSSVALWVRATVADPDSSTPPLPPDLLAAAMGMHGWHPGTSGLIVGPLLPPGGLGSGAGESALCVAGGPAALDATRGALQVLQGIATDAASALVVPRDAPLTRLAGDYWAALCELLPGEALRTLVGSSTAVLRGKQAVEDALRQEHAATALLQQLEAGVQFVGALAEDAAEAVHAAAFAAVDAGSAPAPDSPLLNGGDGPRREPHGPHSQGATPAATADETAGPHWDLAAAGSGGGGAVAQDSHTRARTGFTDAAATTPHLNDASTVLLAAPPMPRRTAGFLETSLVSASPTPPPLIPAPLTPSPPWEGTHRVLPPAAAATLAPDHSSPGSSDAIMTRRGRKPDRRAPAPPPLPPTAPRAPTATAAAPPTGLAASLPPMQQQPPPAPRFVSGGSAAVAGLAEVWGWDTPVPTATRTQVPEHRGVPPLGAVSIPAAAPPLEPVGDVRRDTTRPQRHRVPTSLPGSATSGPVVTPGVGTASGRPPDVAAADVGASAPFEGGNARWTSAPLGAAPSGGLRAPGSAHDLWQPRTDESLAGGSRDTSRLDAPLLVNVSLLGAGSDGEGAAATGPSSRRTANSGTAARRTHVSPRSGATRVEALDTLQPARVRPSPASLLRSPLRRPSSKTRVAFGRTLVEEDSWVAAASGALASARVSQPEESTERRGSRVSPAPAESPRPTTTVAVVAAQGGGTARARGPNLLAQLLAASGSYR